MTDASRFLIDLQLHRWPQFQDADQVARAIAEGTIANHVRLLGRLLDDLGVGGLQTLEGAVEVDRSQAG